MVALNNAGRECNVDQTAGPSLCSQCCCKLKFKYHTLMCLLLNTIYWATSICPKSGVILTHGWDLIEWMM